jgi:penicillin-binding protein 1C
MGVWVGRADNGTVPSATGGGTAALILFEGFARSGFAPVAFSKAPFTTTRDGVTGGLKRFLPKTADLVPMTGDRAPPEIIYPPKGARVELANAENGGLMPLVLKV